MPQKIIFKEHLNISVYTGFFPKNPKKSMLDRVEKTLS